MRFRVLLILVIVTGLAAPARADFGAAQQLYSKGDFAAAFHAFGRLAEQGDADAQARLAEMYFAGRGTARDVEAALRWFRAAAGGGNIAAQVNLGLLLAQAGSEAEAATWFERAARHGDAAAMTSLAALYLLGRGVVADPAKGLGWFVKAAELGDPETQLELATLYARGVGGAPDLDNALKWLRRSAGQGHAPAQTQLGALYAEGVGTVTADLVLAYKWYHLAVMQGAEDAIPALEAVGARMTPAQIDRAKKSAAAWSPSND